MFCKNKFMKKIYEIPYQVKMYYPSFVCVLMLLVDGRLGFNLRLKNLKMSVILYQGLTLPG